MATITIPAQSRIGPVHSPTVIVPAGHTSAFIQFTMPVQAERDDPARRMDAAVEYSADGVIFKPYVMVGWQGGTGILSKDGLTTNPPPSLGIFGAALGGLVGTQCRIAADLPVAITVGATLTVT